MHNDIQSAHKAWLKFVHDNDDKRQQLITLQNEKMYKLEQEEMQLKNELSDKELEGTQKYNFHFSKTNSILSHSSTATSHNNGMPEGCIIYKLYIYKHI